MIECRNDAIVRMFCWTGILALVLFNYASFTSYQEKSAAEKTLKNAKVALLYASPTFHDEVVSSVACTIKDEGYYVIAYVGSGMHVGSYTIPLSDKRQRASESFYGKCVDKWISITEPIADYHLVDDPDLLVFVTYPMLKHNFVHDGEALQLLKHLQSQAASTSVVLITHRTNEALHETLPKVEALVPRDQLTFVFLGEHTQQTTAQLMKAAGHSVSIVDPVPVATTAATATTTVTKSNANAYRLAHFYPIVPMDYIGATRSATEAHLTDVWNTFWYPPLATKSTDGYPLQSFAIQGNFGGKHAHRKDVKGTVECLQRVENSYEEDNYIAAAGTAEMETKKHSVGVENGRKTPLRVSLELIGHLTGDLPLPSLQYGQVRFISDLAPVPYYKAIARSRFMIAAVGEDYMTSRATSSVPASLITHIPLVTSLKFLEIYPCLRDSPIHRKIASAGTEGTECDAIGAAAKLSDEEYEQAKREIITCALRMYEQGKDLFRSLGDEARARRHAQVKTGTSSHGFSSSAHHSLRSGSKE